MRRELPPGTRVGDYEVGAVIGRGGFALTYAATHVTLKQPVALKEYFPETLAHREGGTTIVPEPGEAAALFAWGLARFREEGERLATLDHPHIVRVLGATAAHETAYLAMELVPGESLDRRLARLGPLPPTALDLLADGLMAALEEVHGAGLIHRDVKPHNLIWRPAKGWRPEGPVLIDFGAVRTTLATRTATTHAMVSPGYSPPEQYARAGQPGPATDIYAAAATLHHAVLGVAPPEATERRLAQEDGDPDPLPPLPPTAPPRIRALVEAGLRLRRQDRPQTIAAWWAGAAAVAPREAAPPDTTPAAGATDPRAGTGWELFLSYASEDRETADALCAALEGLGLRCWMAPRDIRAGRPYGDEIARGLEGARGAIVLLSAASNASPWVRREVELATSLDRRLFPVRLDDEPLHRALRLYLGEAQWIEVQRLGVAGAARQLARDLDARTRVVADAAPPAARPGPPPAEPVTPAPSVAAAPEARPAGRRLGPWALVGLGDFLRALGPLALALGLVAAVSLAAT